MQAIWEDLQSNWVEYLWKIAGILLILILARIAIRVLRRIIASSYKKRAQSLPVEKQRRAETSSTIMQSLVRYAVWFLAIMGIVGQLGLTSTVYSMLAAAGVGGLALGIGAQSFIKDVVAGAFFIFEDQMNVGDYVAIAGVSGTIEEITLRYTVVKGFRGELNSIPNGNIDIIVNYSRADYLALVDVNIAHETDIARAMAVMQDEAEAYAALSDDALEQPEVLGVTALTTSGMTLRLVMRVKPMTQFAAERALYARLQRRFRQEGIEIPYQKMVVLEGNDIGRNI